MRELVQRLRSSIGSISTTTALLSSLLIVGCGPSWTVVRQAPQSRLASGQTIELDPIRVDNPKIGEKSEEEWLSKKSPEQRRSWEADKAAMNEWFYQGLFLGLKDKNVNLIRGANQRSVPHLRAVVSRIEPGFYAGVISSPSELDVTLQVVEDSEVSHEITYQSSGSGFSTGERVRAGASQAGYVAAEYIDSQMKSK